MANFIHITESPITMGGIIDDINIDGIDYRLHIFNETDKFKVDTDLEVEYLIVGGGGRYEIVAGGAAGGLKHTFGDPIILETGTYDMVVGKGGSWSISLGSGHTQAGGITRFAPNTTYSDTAFGGGYPNGGSGRGGGSYIATRYISALPPVEFEFYWATIVRGVGTVGQGHAGGYGYKSGWVDPDTFKEGGGGGGGAGSAGGNANASTRTGGAPGAGMDLSQYVSDQWGDDGWFAGGGSGAFFDAVYYGGSNPPSSKGRGPNTGCGQNAARGGNHNDAEDGIIIIRYKKPIDPIYRKSNGAYAASPFAEDNTFYEFEGDWFYVVKDRADLDAKKTTGNWLTSTDPNQRVDVTSNGVTKSIPMNNLITTRVTDFFELFYPGGTKFNQLISNWDTENVTTMSNMFLYNYDFNQDIGSWSVENVSNMQGAFHKAESFNMNIGSWNVQNVKNMNTMFYSATSFNQDLSGWCVSGVTSLFSFNWDTDQWTLPKPNFSNPPC